MKNTSLIIMLLMMSGSAVRAQDINKNNIVLPSDNVSITDVDKISYDMKNDEDSIHLPYHPVSFYPSSWNGYNDWSLHSGLNISLGASVFAEFGKNARHGVGFGQQLSMMYAKTLTNKMSFAIGGYYSNVNWSNNVYQDAGLSAVLAYQFDEHWEGYLYAQKSLMMDNRVYRPISDMYSLGDKIGASVKYNFSPSFSIQLSVEQRFPQQNNFGIGNPQHNYPQKNNSY